MAEPILVLDRAVLRYGTQTVLNGVSLRLEPGERLAILGPSGSGKTSLLRLCAGLEAPQAGTVLRRARRLAFVFQEPRLLPWRTAAENVNLLLSDRGATLPEAERWLARLELAPTDMKKRPPELSGGMQQRVALARALARRGDLLLLDEPFQALDAALRERVMQTVSQEAGDAALLLVTHNPAEAEVLGCRIVRLQNLSS